MLLGWIIFFVGGGLPIGWVLLKWVFQAWNALDELDKETKSGKYREK